MLVMELKILSLHLFGNYIIADQFCKKPENINLQFEMFVIPLQ